MNKVFILCLWAIAVVAFHLSQPLIGGTLCFLAAIGTLAEWT